VGVPRVVVAGSAFEVRGGVSAVAKVCEREGLFRRWNALYLATHCDGSGARKALKALGAWLRLAAMLARREVALLHVHLNSDASFWRKSALVLPALALRVPVVLQVHCGNFPEFYRERCGPRARRFVRWMLRSAAAVAALSQESAAALREIAPDVAVGVVTNPVSVPQARSNLDREPPVVLFLGVVKEAKGAFDLLRAWPRVLEAVPRARLVLAGSGELDRAREIARAEGFAASLETPGWVGEAGKQALFERAWLLALPSHWEAMPMAVLEAQAAGVPVVASRVGGIPSIVEDGRTGLLIEAKDLEAVAASIVAILRDAARRKAMGAAARERILARYSPAAVLPAIEALWRAHLPAVSRAADPGSRAGSAS
jgi:glycosyltransferase involved in cell wall biosynthesis